MQHILPPLFLETVESNFTFMWFCLKLLTLFWPRLQETSSHIKNKITTQLLTSQTENSVFQVFTQTLQTQYQIIFTLEGVLQKLHFQPLTAVCVGSLPTRTDKARFEKLPINVWSGLATRTEVCHAKTTTMVLSLEDDVYYRSSLCARR